MVWCLGWLLPVFEVLLRIVRATFCSLFHSLMVFFSAFVSAASVDLGVQMPESQPSVHNSQ